MKNETKIENLEERHVAFVSFVGNYVGKPEVFKDLFGKLAAWAGPKNLMGPDTVFLSVYQDDPRKTPPEELTLEVCMTVPEDAEVEGDIRKKMLPGGKYAVMRAELAYPKDYGPAWEEVVKWTEENGHELDMSRPSYEIYLNNPEEHPEKHHILDICLAVK